MSKAILGPDRVEILRLAAQGHGPDVLSAWFPYHRNAIARVIYAGASSQAVKLTSDIAAAIRQRHAAGATCVALAREYGVHRNSVHRVLAGTAWAQTTERHPSSSQ